MWSIKGATARGSVTSGSSDPVLIPERFYIQSTSIPSELSIHQARLIWDAAALHLPGSHRSQHAPSFPHCCSSSCRGSLVLLWCSSSCLLNYLCALHSSPVTTFHPTGSCSSVSAETILECANVSKVFLDPFEMKVALIRPAITEKAWVLSWQACLM